MARTNEHEGWEDLRFPVTRVRLGALNKPDFDYTNIGLLFPQNDATEIAYVIAQLPHRWASESNLRPHVHYVQSQAQSPTFKLDWRAHNNGSAVDTSWTTLTQNGNIFAYSSGDILQIATFPEIDMSGCTLSCIVDIRLYRDDNDVAGDILAKEFDCHYRHDSIGSADEYTK